jgi:8-oxo-dGTP pyrophosphatase MutT (NUDIX family)
MTPPNTSMNTKIAGAHVVLHRLLRTSCDKKYVPVVLLCKRTHDAPIHPANWALFGGKLEKRGSKRKRGGKRKRDERPEEAAMREVEEELGIKLIATRLEELCRVCVERANGTWSIHYFRYSLDYDLDKLRLHRNHEGKVEGEGLGWFSAEEIHHLLVRPEDRIAVDTFFREHGT